MVVRECWLSLRRKQASPDGSHHECARVRLGSDSQKCLAGDGSTRGTS
jgi:hypothetical protein